MSTKIRCPILSMHTGHDSEALVFFERLATGHAVPSGIMCEYYDPEKNKCIIKTGYKFQTNESCTYSTFKKFKQD